MEENRNSKLIVAMALGILLLFVWLVKIFWLDRPTLITVVGEGRVRTEPQLVKFTANLINQAVTVTQVVAENSTLTKEAVSFLKSQGVGEEDIVVAYTRVIPPSPVLGTTYYQALNVVGVTLRDLKKLDSLVGGLYVLGVQSITDILFTVDDSRNLEKEAVEKAIEDASVRVKEIAKANKKLVGRMVSIQTVEVGEAGALSRKTSSQEGALTGQLSTSPSQIEIVRQASIVFELR